MKDGFDLSKLTEGMSPDEAMDFVSSTLTPDAVAKYKASKRDATLKGKYDADIEKYTKGLNGAMKIRKISEIKRQYRSLGLEIY